MWQIVACAGAYVSFSLIVTARLAYLIGRHRGLHVRNKDVSMAFVQKDGRSNECRHSYCDGADVLIMYIGALVLTPIFLLITGIVKAIGFVQNGGFNSVQLPENSYPGIEITEVSFKKHYTFWGIVWILTFVVLGIAVIAVGAYFSHYNTH